MLAQIITQSGSSKVLLSAQGVSVDGESQDLTNSINVGAMTIHQRGDWTVVEGLDGNILFSIGTPIVEFRNYFLLNQNIMDFLLST